MGYRAYHLQIVSSKVVGEIPAVVIVDIKLTATPRTLGYKVVTTVPLYASMVSHGNYTCELSENCATGIPANKSQQTCKFYRLVTIVY